MLKRLVLLLALSLAPTCAAADADAVRDRIVSGLREDGYLEIRINRTLLGRMRFVAVRADAQREIVVNPNTGVILRDYVRFLTDDHGDGGSNGGVSSATGGAPSADDNDGDDDHSGGGQDDESDDDREDDSHDDESDDESSDNSGSGSTSSGSGSGHD